MGILNIAPSPAILANAGIPFFREASERRSWIPAFAGMTGEVL